MAARRTLQGLAGRRRRADEEGEEDDGPAMVENSQSEGSLLSDLDDDDESSIGAATADDGPNREELRSETAGEGNRVGSNARRSRRHGGRMRQAESMADSSAPAHSQVGAFTATEDTQAMINGLRIGDQTADEAVDFDSVSRRGSVAAAPPAQPAHGYSEPVGNRQRQDHEDYRRKRDNDPAFIPNRGNFFMHDTRSVHGQGSLSGRGAWGGRGRGRGGGNVGGPHPSGLPLAQAEKAAEQPWKHDLHDTINEESSRPAAVHHVRDESARFLSKPNGPNQQGQQRVLSFSSTKLVGKVQIRVFLDGMKAPIAFSEVPWKHYIRLPDHRPPLRRDKPVRVSLPGHPQRYIFPAAERSFIFIPRQMRPNQQGFGRNAYQRSVGGYGYSSRRTSMYGGSMYAASVAASRRSSFASVSRDNAFSPVGSYGGYMPPSRPNIRMPHGSQSHFSSTSPMGPLSGHQTPNGMQMHTFPLPQQPTYQGIPTTTVHQPRPQKTISVTGIESPAALQQAPGAQDAQPFQNQLPAHMNEQMGFGQPSSMYSPRQQFPYPQPPQSATPLSGIPEQAIHAPSFQPPMMGFGAPPPYYAPYGPPPPQQYYYPHGQGGYQPMPMYAPPPQSYMMSPPVPAMPPQQAPPQPPPSQPTESDSQQAAQAPSGMVAHESNGMVFYLPASEAPQQPQGESYQPAESFVPSYAMPGLPPPTPAPETSYYYPPQVPMQQVGYYPVPTQQQ